jgi:hypothetical protein
MWCGESGADVLASTLFQPYSSVCQFNAHPIGTTWFIHRIPGKARAIEITLPSDSIPPLDRPFKF